MDRRKFITGAASVATVTAVLPPVKLAAAAQPAIHTITVSGFPTTQVQIAVREMIRVINEEMKNGYRIRKDLL